MSIMSYNGAAVVAMKGKDCVAIASDLRFGIQAQTVAMNFQKVFEMGPRLYMGLPGLATDVQTVHERLKFRLNLYELRENRCIKPQTFVSMVSNLLYERRLAIEDVNHFAYLGSIVSKRGGVDEDVMPVSLSHLYGEMNTFGPYFVEPVIAGLDPKTNQPYVASLDLIGCPMITEDFVVSGTCTEQMYGMCESLWEPDLEPDDLFETISQALLNAVDRDAVSGWGAVVHVIEKDKVTTRTLKARMD